jgi:Flp pilus assembly protein TadG
MNAARFAPRRRRGSVLMECTLVMPLLFMLIMGVCQMAHLLTARLMLRYASFCAARAVLVSHDSEAQAHATDAAQKVMGWLGLYAPGSGAEAIAIDGWGNVPDSYIGGAKSGAVQARIDGGASYGEVKVTVAYKLPLVFPVFSVLLADKDSPRPMEPGIHVFSYVEPPDDKPLKTKPLFPVLTMSDTVRLPRPWLGESNPIWRRAR